ncbi:MAG: outer membrane beta-barrel protein [Gammaproteobacteria bacterium]|jgi:hypothetical protein|nr:outer membrane beta-barrel protein [Gammaproteobacteria bacterium]
MHRIQNTTQRLALSLSCFLIWFGSKPALAQSYDNPSIGQLPVVSHPQDFKPLGIRAGGFMLHPGIQLAAEWNDNVFYTAENEIDDLIWHFRPYISAQSNWSQHSFNIRLAADIARYQDRGILDYEDYFVLINGQVDVRSRTYFTYNVDWMKLHESRNNRSAEQGIEPTTYNLLGGGVGFNHTFNRVGLGVDYRYRTLDFDNAIGIDGIIDNQDRDRDESGLSLRLGYQFQTDKQAFIRISSHRVRYDQELDRSDLHRDSDGWYVDAGLAVTMTGKLMGDVFVSYRDQEYDDPRLEDINGWAGGAGLQWTPTGLTRVSARITSSVEQTTYQYSSGFFQTLYGLRVDHELLRDLQISGEVSYRHMDYQLTADAPETARDVDKLWRAGLGATYFFNRHVFLSASYSYEKLKSNLPEDRIDANKFWLVLSLER